MDESSKETDQPVSVQKIIGLVRLSNSNVKWIRYKPSHRGADDGIWFFWLPDQPGDVQIEGNRTWGEFPFVVETDKHNERFVGQTAEEVATKIVDWLGLPGGTFEPVWFRR